MFYEAIQKIKVARFYGPRCVYLVCVIHWSLHAGQRSISSLSSATSMTSLCRHPTTISINTYHHRYHVKHQGQLSLPSFRGR